MYYKIFSGSRDCAMDMFGGHSVHQVMCRIVQMIWLKHRCWEIRGRSLRALNTRLKCLDFYLASERQ